jgi:hypothetical protein
MAKDKSDAKQVKSKGDKKAKSKGDKAKKGKGGASEGITIAGHPRAAAAVRRAKGFGGVGGFALAAYLSHKAGVPAAQVGERALIFGIVGYMVAWACAVTIWRHLVLAEFRHALEAGKATFTPAPAEDASAAPEGKSDADGE